MNKAHPAHRYNPHNNTSKKFVVSTQYFFYFGGMGAFLPYFTLYCYQIGFSGTQIGNLSAARQVAMIIFPMIWGVLADRFSARRSIFIFCSIASVAVWALLLITADFWWMLVILTIYGIFYAPLIPFIEAFTMDVLKGREKSYGRMRLWGSIAFISMVLGLGWGIDQFSIAIILSVILTTHILQALFSLGIPHIDSVNTIPFKTGVQYLFHGRFVIFMIS
ncbi:MAG: MFS transporter, partial [Desulfobacteraceae bacterium]